VNSWFKKQRHITPSNLRVLLNDTVIALVFDDGSISLNGRMFENTESGLRGLIRYLEGIDCQHVLYRLPGASGNLLEEDEIITKPEFISDIEQRIEEGF